MDFVRIYSFHFFLNMLCFKHLKRLERTTVMTTHISTFAYRYFSFTYFMGKAYFGLAEAVCA